MEFVLVPEEVRVLGALIEKEVTTPEYYPLTLNALVNACNQKSNRDPVVAYDEELVDGAIDSLRQKGLAAVVSGAGMRVMKYRERFAEKLNLGRREMALLCVLMLRGPQTVGELHSRTERLHDFADLAEVESVLEQLLVREPDALVVRLPRQPGTKEPRYAHLLSGAPEIATPAPVVQPVAREERLAALEMEVRALRDEIRSLKDQFAGFRSQFE
ncbi:MAG TPA: YceH family protein [Bryobacteraceae bacterium]|nr:YceH family protein [Bryobacteraceae bacterium]